MDQEKTASEIFQEESAAYDKKQAESGNTDAQGQEEQGEQKETPSTPEQSKAPVKDEKYSELDHDEDFQRNVPKEFNKNQAWRKTYWEKKEAQRERESLRQELEQLKSQQSTQKQNEFSENDLQRIAQERGYQLTRQEKRNLAQLESALANLPEDENKAFLRTYANALIQDTRENMMGQLSPILKDVQDLIVETRIAKDQQSAINYINQINSKYGTNIDYAKDIDAEVAKAIQARMQSGNNMDISQMSILGITKEILAEKGIEIGRRISEKESKELNEKKRLANMESGGQAGSPAAMNNDQDAINILREEMKKAGLSSLS